MFLLVVNSILHSYLLLSSPKEKQTKPFNGTTKASLLAEVSHDVNAGKFRPEIWSAASSNNSSEAGRGLSPVVHVMRDLC